MIESVVNRTDDCIALGHLTESGRHSRGILLFSQYLSPLHELLSSVFNGDLTPKLLGSCWPITNKWLLGSFWMLFAQCYWQGVAFPEKALQHCDCQELVSFTVISTTFCYIFQLPLVVPFVGPVGTTSCCALHGTRWHSLATMVDVHTPTLLHGKAGRCHRQFLYF